MDQHLICLETEVANENPIYFYSVELSQTELDALCCERVQVKTIHVFGAPIFLN